MEEHIINDSTTDYGGSRIPTSTHFKTKWGSNLKLLEYYKSWGVRGELQKRDINKLFQIDRLAISRHKKILMRKLGLLKEPKKIKIIYKSFLPTDFFIENAIEKKNTYQTIYHRYDKKDCVLWTKEKEELMKKYDEIKKERDKELGKIIDKIMKRP